MLKLFWNNSHLQNQVKYFSSGGCDAIDPTYPQFSLLPLWQRREKSLESRLVIHIQFSFSFFFFRKCSQSCKRDLYAAEVQTDQYSTEYGTVPGKQGHGIHPVQTRQGNLIVLVRAHVLFSGLSDWVITPPLDRILVCHRVPICITKQLVLSLRPPLPDVYTS